MWQNEVSQIVLANLRFDDYAKFIVLEIQIIDFFNQFRCVFHPEFEDVCVSFSYIRVLNILCEVWNRLFSETYACFVEKCLTSLCHDIVILAHVHVADCGPNIHRREEFKILTPHNPCLLVFRLQEFTEDRAPNMRLLEVIPILLDVHVVVSAFALLHLRDILDFATALTQFFAFSQEVRQWLCVNCASQNRYFH